MTPGSVRWCRWPLSFSWIRDCPRVGSCMHRHVHQEITRCVCGWSGTEKACPGGGTEDQDLAVGVEAPALTANVSHIPGLEPVAPPFPICPVRWTARKSVSSTTGSSVHCATRIHYLETGGSYPAEVCPGVDEFTPANE
ncbi:hypothetical protein PUN28_009612 [Cardiocondyla obscurior]|uniref:Uncharacterized protein n=1 Tax=Cardiocondyla obscurior TaxID=286306 RepID=A0AAW2FWM9_9HYME